MKRLRKHPLCLLAIALTLPLGVAFLYYDYYDDNDLVSYKQISMGDNEDLLGFLRKNARGLVAAEQPLLSAENQLFETAPFYCVHPVSTTRTSSVLRC